MINSRKSTYLDNISFSSSENCTHSFPDHFHEEYTIGVSVSGIQKFIMPGQEILVEPYSIFCIPPGQLHAHYPVADIGWSFKSMYLSPDVVQKLTKNTNLTNNHTFNPLIYDQAIYHSFTNLYQSVDASLEKRIESFLQQLLPYKSVDILPLAHSRAETVEDIKSFLIQRSNQKITLDALALIFKTEKFQLIRLFKKHTGLTPNAYLTILRIEKAKKLLHKGSPIIEAALETGFYDQSHFHHCFKHFTGLTPGNFHNSVSRLQ